MAFKANLLLVAVLLLTSNAWASLTPEQEQARDTGLMLYNQHRGISAVEPLRIAAEAGDIEAQYYLGETLRLNAMYMTAEAAKWYEAAANQGNLFAMLRLSNTRDLCILMAACTNDSFVWRDKVLKLARGRASEGDTLAMRALFNAGQGIGWLEKASEAGDSYAQRLLAGLYNDGEGWFLIPGKRRETIEQLLKASAEGGYPPGMMWHAGSLYEQGNYAEAFLWRKKAAEAGLISGVYAYAKDLLNLEGLFDIQADPVKSYALFYLIAQLQGGGGSPEYARDELEELSRSLTPEQIEHAIEFAKEWEATHPPLSYFVPVYGF